MASDSMPFEQRERQYESKASQKENELNDESHAEQEQARSLVEMLSDIVNPDDIRQMEKLQKDIISRLLNASTTLKFHNTRSSERFSALQGNFKSHTKAVERIKDDLMGIFKRTRKIKQDLIALGIPVGSSEPFGNEERSSQKIDPLKSEQIDVKEDSDEKKEVEISSGEAEK